MSRKPPARLIKLNEQVAIDRRSRLGLDLPGQTELTRSNNDGMLMAAVLVISITVGVLIWAGAIAATALML